MEANAPAPRRVVRPRAEVERGGATLPVVLLQRLARHEGVAKLLGATGALQERRALGPGRAANGAVVPEALRDPRQRGPFVLPGAPLTSPSTVTIMPCLA